MQLRKNQIEPVRRGVNFFRQETSVPSVIVAPTAFGKSILIASIVKELGEKVIVIQPSKELLEQNYNKFISLGGEASIYSASMNKKEIGNVTYATIGSIKYLARQFSSEGIKKIIIDECDRFPRSPHGELRKFLEALNATHVLGLTATPLKLQSNTDLDGNRYSKLVMLTSKSKEGNFFRDIIHVSQINEMVENKFWSPLKYEAYDMNTGVLVFNTTGSDYTEDSLRQMYESNRIEERIIERIRTLNNRKSILVSVSSIDAAISLAKKLPNAAAVYSSMPSKERQHIIENFKSGKIKTVVQVNILSIGFDFPELDCLICGRPTASMSWWYQFVGRATRIHPEKEDALVIDFSGNMGKFGKIEDLTYVKENPNWVLYGQNKTQITGIPLNLINAPIKLESPSQADFDYTLTFGKFKGYNLGNVPNWYKQWILRTTSSGPITEELKRIVSRTL